MRHALFVLFIALVELIHSAYTAARVLLQKPVSFLVSAMCDLSTVFLIGTLAPFREEMVQQAYALGAAAAGTGRVWEQGVLATLFSEGVRWQTLIFSAYFAGILGGTYIIYSLFQGAAWLIAHKTAGQHFSFLAFAKLNLFWFLLYAVYQVLDIIISVRHTIMERVSQTSVPDVLGILLSLATVLMALVALVSYAKLSLRGAVLTLRTLRFYLFAMVALLFAVLLDIILRALLHINPDLGIGIGLFVLPLAAAWLRLFAIFQFTEAS